MNDEELQAVFDAIQQTRDVILVAIDKQTVESSAMAGRLLANSLMAELADIQMTIHAKTKDAQADK